MAAPRDPRDRLPPFLAALVPDPALVKQQSRLWAAKWLSFLHRCLMRFGRACARGWMALSRRGRLLVVCGSFAAVALLVLAIGGVARKPRVEAPSAESGRVESLKPPSIAPSTLSPEPQSTASGVESPKPKMGAQKRAKPTRNVETSGPDSPKPSSKLLSAKQLVPHLPDETKLIRLKTTPEHFVGKTFILCGGIQVSDNYSGTYYFHTEPVYYSFEFLVFGNTWGERADDVVLGYLRKDRGKRIADRIIAAQESWEARGKRGVLACRIKATILPESYALGGRWWQVEIVDVQFLNSSRDGWEPWMVETAE
jgi:hypothetical protein